jgi:sugar lactone lactonase YvrE
MNRSAASARALLPLVVAVASACGGGGGGGQSVQATPVALSFPSEDATTDAESIAIRGTLALAPPIVAVTVNGVAAVSFDGFATFRAELPLSTGSNDVTVEVDRPGRAAATFQFPGRVTRVEPILRFPNALEFDAKRGRILEFDVESLALVAMARDGHGRFVVSDLEHGEGPTFQLPRGLALNADGSRAFVVDRLLEAVVAVDLADGRRTILSDDTHGSGPSFGQPSDVVFDAKSGRLLVSDVDLEGVFAVSPASGDRTVLSDPTHGSGPTLFLPNDLAIDAARGLVYVVESSIHLYSVKLSNGDRTLVSDASRGNGDDFVSLAGAEYDAGADRVLVSDAFTRNVLLVDPVTGDRSTLAGDGSGEGPEIEAPRSIAVDEKGGVAFVVDAIGPAVVKILVKSSDRASVVAPLAVGDGPSLSDGLRAAFDPATRRVFITGEDANVLAVDLVTGERSEFSDATHGTGPVFQQPIALALDAAHGRLLVGDEFDNSLWSVTLRDGSRTVISPAPTDFHRTKEIVVDAAHRRALLVQSEDRITAVDLATGERSTLSTDPGGPLEAKNTDGAGLDPANDRLLVHDLQLGLFAVALSDGARTLVSSQVGGSFQFCGSGVALDPDLGRILLTPRDPLPAGVGAVDPVSGSLSIVSSSQIFGAGRGPTLTRPVTLAIDAANRVAFAFDVDFSAIYEVDLASGDRTIISK